MQSQTPDTDVDQRWTTFYIYFDDKSAAESLISAVADDDFEAELSWSDSCYQWLVLIYYQQANYSVDFDDLMPVIVRLANDYGGVFDGW